MDAKQFLQPTSRYRDAANKLLACGKPGDVLTIEQIRTAIDGAELDRDDLVRVIYRVRRSLERKSLVWWVWRPGDILACLTESQAVAETRDQTQMVSRKAKRVIERASCVDATKLQQEERRQFDLSVAQAQMARMATSRQVAKSLESKGTLGLPKIGDVAKLFEKK